MCVYRGECDMNICVYTVFLKKHIKCFILDSQLLSAIDAGAYMQGEQGAYMQAAEILALVFLPC
jgi:hypothetical protein